MYIYIYSHNHMYKYIYIHLSIHSTVMKAIQTQSYNSNHHQYLFLPTISFHHVISNFKSSVYLQYPFLPSEKILYHKTIRWSNGWETQR